MSNISNKILGKIQEEDIQPEPKYKFLLRSYIFWGATGLSLIIGALAVSVILFVILNQDWSNYKYTGFSLTKFLLLTMPYFWLIASGLFLLLAYYNFKHTKFGYRYRFSVIILIYFTISIVLGGVSYAAGAGDKIEEVFVEKMPLYEKIIERRHMMWQKPEQGILIGKIEKANRNEVILLDPKGNKWQVDVADVRLPARVKLQDNLKVRIIGEKLEDFKFKAKDIRPWRLPGLMKKKLNLRLPMRPAVKETLKNARINS